jgi:hypothetical protein
MSSNINDGILNLYIDNNINSNNSIGIKLSGKGFINNSNISYDRNGIGLQLYNNSSNIKELSIIDTSNINNTNYPTLRYSITSNNTSIKSITSNNIYKPLIINDYITITSNSLGIGTSNPTTSLDIRGNMNLVGSLNLNGNEFSASSGSLPISSATSNLISGTSSFYYLFTSSNAITFTSTTYADLLLVGAGGNGGFGAFSGGGGAGEVIYIPNFLFNNGSYIFNIGIGSTNINNRISKITYNNNELIKANGGGDGSGVNLNYTISGSGSYSSLTYIYNTNDAYISFLSGTTNITFNDNIICDILVVGGGGGGGKSLGSGGGAGGLVYIQNYNLLSGTYTINVGAGGSKMKNGGDTTTPNGDNSTIRYNNNDIITALGGARGNGQSTAVNGTNTNTGGSGAGGLRHLKPGSASIQKTDSSISAISRQYGFGNNGGDGLGGDSYPYSSAGGGGADSVGENASTTKGGNGGNGKLIDITGTNIYYAGGGGGTIFNAEATFSPGSGGLGGGGSGAMGSENASSGKNNTGGGGGGADAGIAGDGGSGIVIIRIKNINIYPAKSGGSGGGGSLYYYDITSNIYNLLINNDLSISINYSNPFFINSNLYNIIFNNGSINIGNIIIDNSYPILKDNNDNTINPVVWYKFDDSTNLGLDYSGNGYNLTNNNSSSYSSSIFTKGTGSVLFNGTSSQYLSTSSFYNLNGISFSICFWYYSTISTLNNINIIGSISAITTASITATNYLQFGIFNGQWGFGEILLSSTGIEEQNTWNFITYTFNSIGTNKEEILYKNGIQIGLSTTKTSSYNFTNLTFGLGRRTLTDNYLYWYGHIDDFRVYNQVLTINQVNELYRGKVRILNIINGANSGLKNNNNSLVTSGFSGTSTIGGNGGSALPTGGYITNITGTNLLVGIGGTGIASSGGGINGINYGDGGSGNGGIGRQGVIILKINDNSTKLLNIKSDNINVTNLNINCNLTIGGTIYKSDGTIFVSSSSTNNYISSQWKNQLNNIYYDKGFIGVGTNNPISHLHLASSNINNDVILRFTDASTGFTSNDGLILEKDSSQAGLLWNFENADLIFGTSNQERLRIKNNGNIGIGTNNPQSLLDIRGNVILSGSLLRPNGSPFINLLWSNSSFNNNNIFYNLGNVGIGTTNPITSLDVRNGNVIINNGNLGIGITNPISQLQLSSSNINSDVILRFTDASTGFTSNDGLILEKDSSQSGLLWNFENADLIFGTSNQERLRIKNTGNIGIGTTNPQALLDIRGDVILSGSLLRPNGSSFINLLWSNSSINSNNIFYNLGNVGIGTTNPISLLDVRNGNVIINNGNLGIGITNPVSQIHLSSSNINSDIILRFTDASTGFTSNDGLILKKDSYQAGLLWNFENADLIFGTSNQERLRIKNNGNIGIGTTNPQTLLDIRGDVILSGSLLRPNGSPVINVPWSNSSINNNNIFYNLGNIGIGTTNPISLLDVRNGNIIINNGNIGIGITNPISQLHLSSNINSDIIIRLTDASTGFTSNDGLILEKDSSQAGLLWNFENADLIFGTLNQERLRIKNLGNIGIGTINPQALLDIRGNVILSGSLTKPDGSPVINVPWSNSSINNNNIFYNLGNVGIGTTNPISLLDVRNGNVIINNGNLGIGTTNPISQLHLSSSINSDIILRFTDASTGNTINDGLILEKDITQAGLLWNFENADLILGTNSQERLRIKNTGNIGIGTTNPQALLDIRGNVILSGSLLKPNGSPVINVPWSNSSINNNNIFYNLGNVGIGTTNPISLLDVRNGNVVINNGNLGIGITNPISQLHLSSNINSDIIIRLTDSSTGFTNNDGLILEKDITQAGLLWNFENADLIFGTNNQERLRIKNTGNIGIGLTNPQSLLDVNGTISCQEILVKNTNISNIIDSKITSTSNILVNYNNLINKPDLSIYATNTSLNNKENPLTFTNGLSRTTNTISLSYDTSTLRLNNGSLQIINDNKWITTGNNIYFTGGNVGIGIASPSQIFQVGDGGRLRIANNNVDYTIIGTDSINNTNTNTRIEILGNGFGSDAGSIKYIATSGDHIFYTNPTLTQISEVMRIKNNGNIGIGTNNPLSKLHIIGDIRLSGTIYDGNNSSYITIGEWTLNSTNIYYNNGSVAIGKNTNNSLFNLEVANNCIIGPEVVNKNFFNHSTCPLTIINPTNISTANDRLPVLHLCRDGAGGVAGVKATFKISKYEISGNNSRTRLDLDLSHDNYDDINVMTIRSDRRVGINISDPQSTLHVGGDIRLSGNILNNSGTSFFRDTFWTQNGTNIYYNLGNVGIGSINPSSSLDVIGDIRLSGNILDSTGSIYKITSTQPINSNIFYYNNSQLNISNFNITTSGSIKTLDLNTNITNVNNLNVTNNLYIGQKLGINITNPSFPLEISALANVGNNFTSQIGLLQTSGSSTPLTYNNTNIVLKANGAIWSTTAFIASSDSRIKNNINDIDDNIALQKILKIEPKTYNYIDFLSKGTCNVYGFIAQQIKEHIPEAITIQNEFIPNIYKIGKIINNNIITEYDISSNIKIYDSIKIITDNEVNDYMIIYIISSNSFIIDKNIETTKDCIIYGTKINDFHTLDKSYIFTLNVCATQDLFKIIQKQQNDINNLELSVNNLLNIVLDNNTSNINNN